MEHIDRNKMAAPGESETDLRVGALSSKPRRPLLRIAVAVFVLALFILAGRRYLSELHRLADVSFWPVVAMVVSLLIARVVNGKILQVLLRKLGHSVTLWETFLLNVVMSYTNLFLPRVGMGTPAVYLKHKHGVSYAECSAMLVPIVVLQVISIGVLGLVSQGVLRWNSGEPVNVEVAVLFAVSGIAGFGALFIRVPIPDRFQGRLARFLRRLIVSWRELGSARLLIAHVLGLRIVLLFLRVIRLHLAFVAIGQDTTFPAVLIATMLGELAMLVSVTPAGLGFREAVVAYSASMLGCSPSIALTAAVLDRLVMTICVVILAQVGIINLIRPILRGRLIDRKQDTSV